MRKKYVKKNIKKIRTGCHLTMLIVLQSIPSIQEKACDIDVFVMSNVHGLVAK